MSYVTSNFYNNMEPYYVLLFAMIKQAQDDMCGGTERERYSAYLFLYWCETELVYYLEDIAEVRGIVKGR